MGIVGGIHTARGGVKSLDPREMNYCESICQENGVLTLSGERKFEKEEKNKKYHRVERAYGGFMRRFTLPDDADPENVKAEFKDGMLTVHLSKSAKAKPKQREVAVA
jgi:HSP20 family protein